MFEPPLDLSAARILVSNDDGIHATGIKVLERIARSLSDDVWVVAPEAEQSGAGHSLTIARPLRIRRMDDRHFAVDGTPTDSVLLAVKQIMKMRPPDLVLSGINRGGNMGEDITYSGTVAAAMEGTMLGIPSIAFSQTASYDGPTKWATAEHFAAGIVRRLAALPWGPNIMMNVNFPDVPAGEAKDTVVTRQGKRKIGGLLAERFDPRGKPYYWITTQRDEELSPENSDIRVVNDGYVSITPLFMDLTHTSSIPDLKRAFGHG
jgi:5'-nucleotidase